MTDCFIRVFDCSIRVNRSFKSQVLYICSLSASRDAIVGYTNIILVQDKQLFYTLLVPNIIIISILRPIKILDYTIIV